MEIELLDKSGKKGSALTMGNCVWRVEPTDADDDSYTAKNMPLKREVVRWRSEVALTLGQLLGKRDEFWETAPAFEGRQEIWDAIKVAATAVESEDYVLAQAILDGAGIYTPTGSLTDAYDELGNHYQVPIYCLSRPVNLHTEEDVGKVAPDYSDTINPNEVTLHSSDLEDLKVHDLKVRISTTGEERELKMQGFETVGMGKKKIARDHSGRQRWYFCGKLMEDKATFRDLKIPKDYIIQVVITPIEDD